MTNKLFIIIGLMMMWANAGAMGLVTGNDLYESYLNVKKMVAQQKDADNVNASASHLMGYVRGRVEAMAQNGGFCSTSAVSTRQLVDIVGRYLETNPEKRSLTAGDVVVDAVGKAFPCIHREPWKPVYWWPLT